MKQIPNVLQILGLVSGLIGALLIILQKKKDDSKDKDEEHEDKEDEDAKTNKQMDN